MTTVITSLSIAVFLVIMQILQVTSQSQLLGVQQYGSEWRIVSIDKDTGRVSNVTDLTGPEYSAPVYTIVDNARSLYFVLIGSSLNTIDLTKGEVIYYVPTNNTGPLFLIGKKLKMMYFDSHATYLETLDYTTGEESDIQSLEGWSYSVDDSCYDSYGSVISTVLNGPQGKALVLFDVNQGQIISNTTETVNDWSVFCVSLSSVNQFQIIYDLPNGGTFYLVTPTARYPLQIQTAAGPFTFDLSDKRFYLGGSPRVHPFNIFVFDIQGNPVGTIAYQGDFGHPHAIDIYLNSELPSLLVQTN